MAVPSKIVFYYFGYGSNLSVVSLRAKGVDPLTSEAAILFGWRLVFDIPDFFTIEGGTGNIEPCAEDAVHGVLHGCRSRDLAKLDELEALGIRYERVETSVVTYSGRRVHAYVYVGLDEVLEPSHRPSDRYKNILVRGAVDMSLDPRYIERLRAIETWPRPDRGPFVPPPSVTRRFTLEQLGDMSTCTALSGHVFDMTRAREAHAYLRKLLGRKDATLLFLKRMDTSTGMETHGDVAAERFSPAQRAYLDSYLHEFAREYDYVGRLDYASSADSASVAAAPRVDRPSRPSWGERFASSTSPAGLMIGSRAVLEKGEDALEELGHENLGFLSQAHGFIPSQLPRLEMPKGYEAWDQIASELPSLYRSLSLRRRIDALPILPADPEHLPDDALLRAALLLAMLSHAYQYVETAPAERPPETLARPWAEVRARLGRGPAVLTYQDLIVYNFRLLDPNRPDPMALSNMRLLVPTVDNDEERIFYLTQTQILAYASPIVSAVVRAQEAVVTDDGEALESALMTIITCLQRIVRESLLAINPNPDAPSYVDPVVWAKTVAPFAVPMKDGVQGPSGTSSPIFNTLDIFFGRKKYETFLGREIHGLRDTYPPLWREFLAALHEISVPEYVETRGKPHLRGLLSEARSVYAGPNGFLGRHRMKVYGYLELAFKIGRSVTIGGFSGMFKDRTWDQVDAELEKARAERVQSFPRDCYQARIARVLPDATDGTGTVFDVVLDVSGTGLRYEPGDRCGVLPENSQELVERTLRALGARGDERIPLSGEWVEALRLRHGYEHAEELALEDLLRFGQLRPLYPRAAEALHALTQNDALERALREGKTHHWELWDALEMLRADGFEPHTLLEAQSADSPVEQDATRHRRWRERPSDAHQPLASTLCEIVPPETFRMYSISSVVTSAETEAATEIRLTVAPASYEGPDGVRRYGVGSTFLTSSAGRTAPISIVIEHPARFGLPRDAKTPLVMIAGGSGVAPFRGFLAERRRQLAPAEAWLFLGVRRPDEVTSLDELAEEVKSGRLELQVAFSRDDVELTWDEDEGRFAWSPGQRRYVTELLTDDENARRLWELLHPEESGGRGAHVYVCGRTRFASGAIAALREVLARFAPGTPEEREAYATRLFRELSAQGRFMQEIFSGDPAAEDLEPIDVSEIARHNDDDHGYWIVVEGRVYDVTEYIRLHPGGMRILAAYSGMDATDGYARAHHARTEIDATREMYVIGVVRALDLKGPSVTVRRDGGAQIVSLGGAYRGWVSNLYLAVEMQNALRSDHALQSLETTRGESLATRSAYRLQRAIETHQRFLYNYVEGLASESFPSLWELTSGVFDPEREDWMRDRLSEIRRMPAARFVDGVARELEGELARWVSRGAAEDDPARARLEQACEILEAYAARFLADVKTILRDGVRVFEERERETFALGAEPLLAACQALPEALLRYYAAVELRVHGEGGWRTIMPNGDEAARPSSRPPKHRVLACSDYWFVEEHIDQSVVVIRRTPISFDSLDVLVRENDSVIGTIRSEHARFGVVVDMRQAPSRNDPEFEGAMRALRETVTNRFARLAVLIESAAGVLQVTRLGRGEGQRVFATRSETDAMRFARGET